MSLHLHISSRSLKHKLYSPSLESLFLLLWFRVPTSGTSKEGALYPGTATEEIPCPQAFKSVALGSHIIISPQVAEFCLRERHPLTQRNTIFTHVLTEDQSNAKVHDQMAENEPLREDHAEQMDEQDGNPVRFRDAQKTASFSMKRDILVAIFQKPIHIKSIRPKGQVK